MSLQELFASLGDNADAPASMAARLKEYSALTDNADRVAYIYALPMVQKILATGTSGLKSPHESRRYRELGNQERSSIHLKTGRKSSRKSYMKRRHI